MPFLTNRGDDDEDDGNDVAAGAPPQFDVDWDPNDPEQTKVHYNLSGWGFEQRAELAESLAEMGVPHMWEGEELVVPEAIEGPVDALFDALEAEIGPFPVPLDDGAESTEFGLDEWPFADIETLKQSLVDAEIPHRWERTTLFVAVDAEHVVDDLLDAIEAGAVASLDADVAAPDGALHDLYLAADQLRRDPAHSGGRTTLFKIMPQLSDEVPPFGLAIGSWTSIMEAAHGLVAAFEASSAPEELQEAATELHGRCRPWV